MSPRPAQAIVQIANERGAGLLVLGTKRRRVSWRFDRAAREVRRNAACLVWIADDSLRAQWTAGSNAGITRSATSRS